MRTTIRIEDALLAELKEQAHKGNISLTHLLDRTLRAGLRASKAPTPRRKRYREETKPLGEPRVELDKALTVAAALEEEEAVRKMALRK